MGREELTAEEQAVADSMNRLRGRLCGLIESWGVGEKQERAMISTLKSLTYDGQQEINEIISQVRKVQES